MFRHYASGNSGQVLCDLNHLQSLKMVGDNIEGFHNTWNMVVSELASRPEETTLQFVYYHRIKNFKPMHADVAHYLRAQWNNGPEHCLQWRWDASCRSISQQRQDYMQEALSQGLRSNRRSHSAPGVTPPGEGER